MSASSAEGAEGAVAGLYRHPVKSFTPERLAETVLEAGEHFPADRLYAVENGPSGFDPEAPEYLNKMKFAVLARMPQIARIRTRYDDATGRLSAARAGLADITADLESAEGRAAFAAWLDDALAEIPHHALSVLRAPRHHAFMDDGGGFVSLINLASVRDFEARIGRPVDPLRFRGNILVEGWPAWTELDMTGARIAAGDAVLEGVEPIARCTATHVDPQTGTAELEVVQALRAEYGHRDCGLYAKVVSGGRLAEGDPVRRVS